MLQKNYSVLASFLLPLANSIVALPSQNVKLTLARVCVWVCKVKDNHSFSLPALSGEDEWFFCFTKKESDVCTSYLILIFKATVRFSGSFMPFRATHPAIFLACCKKNLARQNLTT